MTFAAKDHPSTRRDVLALAQELRPALLRASRQLRRQAQRAGASALDAQILHAIAKTPGAGPAELAAREQMTRPSMSGHLKRLETAGWLARDLGSAADRRRVSLRLTPAGEKALEAIRRRRDDWLALRLAAFSPVDRAALAAAIGPLLLLASDS